MKRSKELLEVTYKAISLVSTLVAAAAMLLFQFDKLRVTGREALFGAGALLVAGLVGMFSYEIARRIRKLSRTPRVFISYPHGIRDVASSIAAELKGSGTKVWMDVEHIRAGDSIQLSIEQALNNTDAFVFLLPATMTEYASKELQIARAKGLKIIPVVVNHDATIPAELRGVKYVDMTTEPRQGIEEIVAAVG